MIAQFVGTEMAALLHRFVTPEDSATPNSPVETSARHSEYPAAQLNCPTQQDRRTCPVNEMTPLNKADDKTDTETFVMEGKCPFGGDRVGGALGTPPTLENWYPDRLRVELLHQNGLAADPMGPDFD